MLEHVTGWSIVKVNGLNNTIFSYDAHLDLYTILCNV